MHKSDCMCIIQLQAVLTKDSNLNERLKYMTNKEKYCECHRCIEENGISVWFGALQRLVPLSATKMILCPKCGNKRCPHASDHRLDCTGSNEPGQPGSVYE